MYKMLKECSIVSRRVSTVHLPRAGRCQRRARAWKNWPGTMGPSLSSRAGTSSHAHEPACARAGTGSFRKGRGEDMATAAAQDGSQDGGRDLTGRARIRNAGLHLFAANGFAGTPLRSIAAEAGVAIGLISHHFGSKDGLREAVESWIIDLFDTAIDSADQQSADPVADAAGRDAAVARMLEDHPLVVDYLRREL